MAAIRSLQDLSRPMLLMNTVSPILKSTIGFNPAKLRCPCRFLFNPPRGRMAVLDVLRVRARVSDSQLKEGWLDSLSCPFREMGGHPIARRGEPTVDSGSGWVVGIDPDSSGALALLKPDPSGCSAEVSCLFILPRLGDPMFLGIPFSKHFVIGLKVFDTPYLQVLVGKKVRKRLDTRSIVQLLHSFGAPLGTIAYIEQSTPFPQDGKQGWWSGGFTYGLWIGSLVASGFSVVPVSSRLWKDQFELSRSSSTKDDSRLAASTLFPSLSSSLKRKKDHGRAEALLIAAYGKGLVKQSGPGAE